jgi:hypothetical protein
MECFESNEPISEREHRVKIPSDWGDWLGTGFRGRVSYQRTFGRPTHLEPEQKVWLVVEETDFRAAVSLNEVSIGMLQLGSAPLRVEIQHLLQLSNRLNISVELPLDTERGLRNPLAGGLIGGVRIEIEES